MYKPKSCFVIMPYGKKTVGKKKIDFDIIYETFHKVLITKLGFEAIRCDHNDKGGAIHLDMFEHIYDCALVIADLTGCNPNVMYELGVRHTLTRAITVMIKQEGTAIPFNISGYKILEYNPDDPKSLQSIKRKIQNMIKGVHKDPKSSDSPVLDRLKVAVVDDTPKLPSSAGIEKKVFELHAHAFDKICILKGDLDAVTGIDIWVNSENTHMEMARPIESTISSFIRYYGARRNKVGGITNDKIYMELQAHMSRSKPPFAPATVFTTTAGELFRTHKVKHILHVAAADSGPVKGFKPVQNLADCVSNCMKKANELSDCESILFPLFGTGQARGSLETTAPILLDSAINYLKQNPDSPIDLVYFLAQTERQADVCINYLRSRPDLAGPT